MRKRVGVVCREGAQGVWFFVLCLLGMVAMAVMIGWHGGGPRAASGMPAIAADTSLTLDQRVDAVLGSMTTTEKVGQLVMMGIYGTDVNQDSLYLLRQFHIGGVILFDRNMETAGQVKQLVTHLQEAAHEKVPLFIALDEEGGLVARMRSYIPAPPSQEEVGQSGNPQLATSYAEKTAGVMKSLGINVNFAPVADLGSLHHRHYSTDPTVAISFLQGAANGYEQAGMIYALKHFPGIGKGKTDSHLDTVVVPASKDTLMTEDVQPFKAMIDSHPNDKFFVLVSHISYPQIDAEHPATLSPAIMTTMLRDELGFKGVIITDDMDMGAISNHYQYRDVGVQSFLAGADIIMVCQNYEHVNDVYMGLLDAVKSGKISQERLNASVRRILKMKLENLVH